VLLCMFYLKRGNELGQHGHNLLKWGNKFCVMGPKYMGLCILGFRFNFEMFIFVRRHLF